MIKKVIISIIAVVILGVGYYLISPIFRTITVNDVNPAISDETGNTTDSEVAKVKLFPVIGSTGHPASGNVRIIDTANGKVVRYEEFKTINGPDLYVYLAKDLDAKEFVSLGEIRGTEGNINYTVPKDVNIEEYKYVMTWCKQFNVLFNYADISI